jgi:hypothetical protein
MRASEPRGLPFWIKRYFPAEVAGSATLFLAGLTMSGVTDSPAAIAYVATIGEIVGFYLVLGATVFREQRGQGSVRRPRAFGRTLMLLAAEFGAAELLDTLLVRPAAMTIAVWTLDSAVWGLVVGKIVADLAFYTIAAGAFIVTTKTGIRSASPDAEPATDTTIAA